MSKLRYVPAKEGCKSTFPTLKPGQVFEPQGNIDWYLEQGCFEVVEEPKKQSSRSRKKE